MNRLTRIIHEVLEDRISSIVEEYISSVVDESMLRELVEEAVDELDLRTEVENEIDEHIASTVSREVEYEWENFYIDVVVSEAVEEVLNND